MKRELAVQIAELPDSDLEELKLLIDGLLGKSTEATSVAGLDLSAWRGYRAVRTSPMATPSPPPTAQRAFTASDFVSCLEYWADAARGTDQSFLVWGGSESNPQPGTIRRWASEQGLDHGGRSGFRIAEAFKEALPRVGSGKRVKRDHPEERPPERDALPGPARRYFWLPEFEEAAREEARQNGWAVAVDSEPAIRWLF